jgi:replicative DNA helicase
MKNNAAANLNESATILKREMPMNIEAEQGLLGAFLNNNEHITKVADFLRSEHFALPIHGKIFAIMEKFLEKGMLATPVSLKSYFQKEDLSLEGEGSIFDYLVKLSTIATTVVNVSTLARAVHNDAMVRQLINLCEDSINHAYEHNIDKDHAKLIEETEQKLFNLANSGTSERNFSQLRNSILGALTRVDAAMKRGTAITGVSSGYIELDKLMGGMQNSDLIILAARPSMGKTSLAVNIAINAAEFFTAQNKKEEGPPKSVGIFSLEMSAEQVATRILSIKTAISSSRIRIGNIGGEEFKLLSQSSIDLSNMPIFIDDTPALSISAVRTRARRLKRQHNLGFLVVDYLQLLTGTSKTEGSRVNEIGEITQGLKAIAKELNIPVIALSQLSRAVESREDKRPMLSDLRESGNIEQDADIVMFIYRAEYYHSRKKPVSEDPAKMLEWQEIDLKIRNLAEVIIAKQRNGPIGNVCLRFDNETTGFYNLDTIHGV